MKNKTHRLSGGEHFTAYSKPADENILDFWQCMCSKLNSSEAIRALGCYLTASALNVKESIYYKNGNYFIKHQNGSRILIKEAVWEDHLSHQNLKKIKFDVRSLFGEEVLFERIKFVSFFIVEKYSDNYEVMDLDNWKFFMISYQKFLDFFSDKTDIITLDDLRVLDVRAYSFKTIKKAFHQEIRYIAE